MSIPPSVAVLSLLALAGGCAEPYPLDDELRVTDVQVIGTHNSYHVMINELDAWNYTHAPLDEQIRDLGVRQFELDAWWDEDEARWNVLHIPTLDPGTTCETLRDCFEDQAAGSAEVEDHLPIVTLLELKSGGGDEDQLRLDALLADLSAVWPQERLLTPRQVQGDAPTLAEAVASEGWPTLREARGKAIYVLHAGDTWRGVLTDDDRSVGDSPLFAEAGGDLSCTTCAVQTTCDAGEKISPDSKTAARSCSSCGANTYQSSTGHREMLIGE